jgi:hypothetical protein
MQTLVLEFYPLLGLLLLIVSIYFWIRSRENASASIISKVLFTNDDFKKMLLNEMTTHCEHKHIEHQEKLMSKIKDEFINPLMQTQKEMQKSMEQIAINVASITGELKGFLKNFEKN